MAKRIREYKNLSRTPFANYARGAFSRTGRYNPLAMFEKKALWGWISSYLKYVFLPRHDFLRPNDAPNGTSCYSIPNQLRISLAGDWGSGTEEAECVAEQMMRWEDGGTTDISIHIGDVYYVGDEAELRANCLGGAGTSKPPQDCVTWPIGSIGSFALNGNHEMYANGNSYFNTFLPALGMLNSNRKPEGQGPSFFCLENDYWRIIGLDTGYNSVGVPILSFWFDGSAKLHDVLIQWLRDTVQPPKKPKATILLSHHQYFSAFEKDYRKPAQQLEEFFSSPVIWIFGHEHRLAGYKLFGPDALQAHGRCIGHGGMPVDHSPPVSSRTGAPYVLFYDGRKNPVYPDDDLGYNGFAQLHLKAEKLSIEYLSIAVNQSPSGGKYAAQPLSLLREEFTCAGEKITYNGVQARSNDPDFIVRA